MKPYRPNAPTYYPLTNRHLRYYFSNPERSEFRNDVEHRHFEAVQDVLSGLKPSDVDIIKSVITSYEPIPQAIKRLAGEDKTKEASIYKKLTSVSLLIAQKLFYVSD